MAHSVADPLTRLAPAEGYAGCVPPSPLSGRGKKDRHLKATRTLTCLGISLWLAAAVANAQTGKLPDLIAQHDAQLAAARAAGRSRDTVVELNILASLYRQSGQAQKALDYCNQALTIEQNAGFRTGAAISKDILGRIYTDMGQEEAALKIFNEIVPFWQSEQNQRRAERFGEGARFKRGEASTLSNLGRVYNNLGQKDKALEYLNQSLPLWREAGNRSGEAETLDSIGRAYADMGQGAKSLEYFQHALELFGQEGEIGGAGLVLCNLGKAYADLGQKQKALDSYNRALEDFRQVGNRQGEANALNYLGRFYADFGQADKALAYLNQALPIWREVGTPAGIALALNDIGRVYTNLHEGNKALDYYNQALPLWRETGNRRGEAVTLSNLGRTYSQLGERGKALENDSAAIPLWRQVNDRRGEAFGLALVGKAYYDLGQLENASRSELAALSLAKEAGDPDLVGAIESALMVGLRDEHQPEAAILFGLAAVNSYQEIRRNIAPLDKALQEGFAQVRSSAYHLLAELLVQADRLPEAEEVLDLLKEQELKEVVRGTMNDEQSKLAPLKLTTAQQAVENELSAPEKKALGLTDLTAEFVALQAKSNRTPDEDARLKTLETQIEAGNSEISEFFRKTLYPQLARTSGAQDANALVGREKSELSRLQNTLAGLGPHVLGVRLLLGQEHAYAMVITAHARKKFELNATPAELRSKVLEVRDDLRRPASAPKPHLAELYDMVAAPLEEEFRALEQGGNGSAPIILWSLDGVLRYLPMSALYDGRRYLVERFENVLFTPESYGHMIAGSPVNAAGRHVLAMGLSKSYGGLPPLPGVLPELEAVVRDPIVPASHGPMEGKLLSNEQFTLAALKAELGAGHSVPVVHIASHFVADADASDEPYLMLGGENAGTTDGFALTLSRLEDSAISFHGTELLTLSACSTAKGDAAKDGLEMDSLGMVAQQKDAQSVVATLWDVSDASTSRLMGDFYARWVKRPAEGKAEALRQAQLAFLRGPAELTSSGGERGVQAVPESSPSEPSTGYSHPFYWAPFVLIGNYR